jgi:hypothetical protein
MSAPLSVERVSAPNLAMFMVAAYEPWLQCACCCRHPGERPRMSTAGSFFPEGSDALHGYLICLDCTNLGPEEAANRVEANAPTLPSFAEEGVVILGGEPDEEPS